MTDDVGTSGDGGISGDGGTAPRLGLGSVLNEQFSHGAANDLTTLVPVTSPTSTVLAPIVGRRTNSSARG